MTRDNACWQEWKARERLRLSGASYVATPYGQVYAKAVIGAEVLRPYAVESIWAEVSEVLGR